MEIGAFEAKNTFGTLLDRVQGGEEIVISRHGKPVARLIPEGERKDRTAARAAAARIRARTVDSSISVEEWMSFRDEGRP